MMKKIAALFLALVLVICLIPSLGLTITGPSQAGANEVLSPLPALVTNGKLNGNYPAKLQDYVNDHFAFRQELITLWAKINMGLFHSSVTDSVMAGDGDWLYYASTLDDYTGSAPMTERELWCAGRALYLLQNYAEAQGGSFLFTVAPNKNSLYSEAMPPISVLSEEKNAERIYAVLDQLGVHYLDLRSLFREQDETLYFHTDSHWNGRGAALACDGILEALGRKSDYFLGEFTAAAHRGDLYEMLYPAGKDLEADYAYAPGFGYTVTSRSDDPDSITLTTQSDRDGTLLCYRDSFGRNLFPYLADSFGECTFSRKNDYSPAEIAEGTVMVVELVERNLRYLLDNTPTMPAPEATFVASNTVQGEAVIREEKCSLDGYRRYTGAWEGIVPQAQDCVYVLTGTGAYEAFPTPEGFSLCLPDTEDLTNGGNYIIVGRCTVSIRTQE